MEEFREQSRFAGPLAVVLAAIGAFTLVSLLSFHTSDGSFNSYTAGAVSLHNMGGHLGAQLADFLIQILGAASYVIPFCLLYSAAILILARELPEWGLKELVATLLLAGSLAGLLELWADRIYLLGQEIYAGGAIGKLILTLGVSGVGKGGVIIACATLGGLASVYLFRFSFTSVFRMVSWSCKRLVHQLASACTRRFFARRDTVELDGVLDEAKLDGTPVLSVKVTHEEVADEALGEKGPKLHMKDELSEKLSSAPDFMDDRVDDLMQTEDKETVILADESPKAQPPRSPIKIVPPANVATTAATDIFCRLTATGGGRAALPSVNLLDEPQHSAPSYDSVTMEYMAEQLTGKLCDYQVKGRVTSINPGPVVTMFEFEPASGTKVSKIQGLENELAMGMHAASVRILGPIPGKGVVGVEIPNKNRETVYLKEIFMSHPFVNEKRHIPLAMGKNTSGAPVVADLAKMPHLLVAGSTGSGKSVFINSVILSILFTRTPDEVRLIMVDPKMLELSVYDGIPHLLLPVVTDPKKAAAALRWGVNEMTRRYQLMSNLGVRNIANYNTAVERLAAEEAAKAELEQQGDAGAETETVQAAAAEEAPTHVKLPYVVIIVDELADLMMVAGKDVEEAVARLAQMARAAGIHLILATQRPSVDVVTGLIKANFPSRVAFKVSSKIDSRTILDCNGAETLLGNGDMLFHANGQSMQRVHGAFVSDDEVSRVVTDVKAAGTPDYIAEIVDFIETGSDTEESEDGEGSNDLYQRALSIVAETRQASISSIQRKLKIGYNRAADIVERMEREGIVSPSDGTSRPREVYLQNIHR